MIGPWIFGIGAIVIGWAIERFASPAEAPSGVPSEVPSTTPSTTPSTAIVPGSTSPSTTPSTATVPGSTRPSTASTTPSAPRPSTTSSTTPSTPSAPKAPIVRDRARLDQAAALALRVAEQMRAAQGKADPVLLREFQLAAGITADGVYGPQSAGAIRWYTLNPKTMQGAEWPLPKGKSPAPYLPTF